VRDGRTYRIEVKRLAASEHDELRSRTMQALNTALKSDTQSIVIDVSAHFGHRDHSDRSIVISEIGGS
jgi:hypothetical protein